MLRSNIHIRMVGDIRQSVLATNARSQKNGKYSYAGAIQWLRERQSQGLLDIVESATTWRCHPLIASFSDTIFDSSWQFPATNSKNAVVTGHDGVFLVGTKQVEEYVATFAPQCLRHSVSSGKALNLDYLKGFKRDDVPTCSDRTDRADLEICLFGNLPCRSLCVQLLRGRDEGRAERGNRPG